MLGHSIYSPQKNNQYHEGIKQIPYVLQYGQPCHVGLSKMNLPPALLEHVESDEDLQRIIERAEVVVAPQQQVRC